MVLTAKKLSPPSNLCGFTLLEVMLTTVLFVTGLVVVLPMFSAGMFADSNIEGRVTALLLAQEKMEEIKDSATYAGINGFAAGRGNIGGDFAEFDREITVAGEPKEVHVLVYWSEKDTEQNINLASLFSDYDYE